MFVDRCSANRINDKVWRLLIIKSSYTAQQKPEVKRVYKSLKALLQITSVNIGYCNCILKSSKGDFVFHAFCSNWNQDLNDFTAIVTKLSLYISKTVLF
jgi:hypothetical protein